MSPTCTGALSMRLIKDWWLVIRSAFALVILPFVVLVGAVGLVAIIGFSALAWECPLPFRTAIRVQAPSVSRRSRPNEFDEPAWQAEQGRRTLDETIAPTLEESAVLANSIARRPALQGYAIDADSRRRDRWQASPATSLRC